MKRLAATFTCLLFAINISAVALDVLVGRSTASLRIDAARGKDGSTRFMVTGDSRGSSGGVNDTILAEIAQVTIEENVDFILIPGDLVYGSLNPTVLEAELLQWRDIMQPVYDAGIDVYPCRGNHDAGSKVVWDSVFSGPYALPGNGPSGEENITFSFIHDNIFVVGLDQYVNPNRVNQTWLNEQFAANAQPHVFVFGHAPAFKVRHWDCLDDHPDDRDTFWFSIAAEGGRTYFCGHDHFYDHARLDDGDGDADNDLHQLIVGTAGAPLRDDGEYNGNNGPWTPQRVFHEREFGYVLVEVNGLSVTLTWKHRVAEGVYVTGEDVWTYVADYDTCCVGIRGNVDGDPSDQVDVADVTYLVDYMFFEGAAPPCEEEGNVDGMGGTNIGDLTYLVGFLYFAGPVPPPCP